MKMFKSLAMLLIASALTLGVSAQGSSSASTTKPTSAQKASNKGTAAKGKTSAKTTAKPSTKTKTGGSSTSK